MGFGFVVARFGLFLESLRVMEPGVPSGPYGLSVWFGTALLVLGVVVNVMSAWRHVVLVRQLNAGGAAVSRPSLLAIGVAMALAVVGLAMAVYLISVREARKSPAALQIQGEGRARPCPTGPEGGARPCPRAKTVLFSYLQNTASGRFGNQ